MERSGVDIEQELQAFEERRRRRRERRKRQLVMTVVVTVLALLLFGLTAYLTYHRGMRNLGLSSLRQPVPGSSTVASAPEPAGEPQAAGRINVLVVGTDEEIDRVGRTDTIMLVSFDPRTGDAGVLSIPRDTRVEVPGRGFQRINVAYAVGGPELLRRTVEQLLGVPVHYYVALNFTSFERFIDALGGIEVDIPRPMKYDDYAQGLHIDLPAGRQVLNGRQALHYVRYRDALGDVSAVDPARGVYDGRVRRQLEFAELVARKVFSVSTLPRLPQLVQELFGMVRTDISLDRALALLVSARNFDVSRLQTAVLPGTAGTVNGASYWLMDAAKARVVVDRVIRGLDLVTVEVLNGSGRPGAATAAADWLRSNGYDVVRVGNAPAGFSYERTQVIVNRAGVDVEELTALLNGRLASPAANSLAGDGAPAGVLVVQAAPVLRDPAFVETGEASPPGGGRNVASAAPSSAGPISTAADGARADSAATGGAAAASPRGGTAAGSAATAGSPTGPDVTIVLGMDFWL